LFNETIDAEGAIVFAKAREFGLEGIVSKRLGGTYWSGRCRNWVRGWLGKNRRCVVPATSFCEYAGPRRGLNDISVLSKSCYGGCLSRDKAVIWRCRAADALERYVAICR
jgi:hypothetical protein